mmetsp:Transcript_28475/g.42089  ORF Transcript_28475/g.42089 Transcript_28475/m.42089 type:complete len:109 (-) Transcript_28475:220-546(-)
MSKHFIFVFFVVGMISSSNAFVAPVRNSYDKATVAIKAHTGNNAAATAMLFTFLTWTAPIPSIAATTTEMPAIELSQEQKTLCTRVFYGGCIAEWLYLTIKQPGSDIN